mmetsp:Transcript_43411/g.137234  ORF Transcript_43411/g.137234 Transcript_43411/m.137234 type:complete len:185 (+) Transcript_43411:456-1010(+)
MQCRIFQKEGMIERLEGLLVPLDEMKYSFTCSCSDQPDLPAGRTGTVPCDDFINAITRSQLLPLRLSQFLRDQRNNRVVFLSSLCPDDGATGLSKGSKTVDYLTLLERLKIERNRSDFLLSSCLVLIQLLQEVGIFATCERRVPQGPHALAEELAVETFRSLERCVWPWNRYRLEGHHQKGPLR